MKKYFFILSVLMLFVSPMTYGNWNISSSKDEMTGEKSAYAISASVNSTEKMSFPYTGTKARIGLGCNKKSEWVYITFTNAPNLNDIDIDDGYNFINTRIKWDDEIENVTFTQNWGDRTIHFRYDADAISKVKRSNSILLELNWHGQGRVYFKFPLHGVSAAIQKIRNQCQ